METQPAWVKAAQNGAIGEARSRSFLLDRFWILERSIDIHGADFIIQRRLTNKNILDRNAPRLGVVQAKFVSSSNTASHIHCEYVVDNKSVARDEFFLLVHTGNEGNQQIYFLTAKEIAENFEKVTSKNCEKYKIPGSIIKGEKFKVSSRREVLDRIETQLIEADFAKNREYLKWTLSSSEISIDDIVPEYNIPIDNSWGDIPEGFYETKKYAAEALDTVENVYSILKSITEEIDPCKICEYLEDFRYYCRGGSGNWFISLPSNIYDEGFIDVVKRHQEIIYNIKNNKKLDEYLRAHDKIENDFAEFLCGKLPFNEKLTHKATIEFNDESLEIISIKNELIEEIVGGKSFLRKHDDCSVLSLNTLEYCWNPLYITYGTKRYNEVSDRIRNNCKYVSSECMRAIVNKCLHTEY